MNPPHTVAVLSLFIRTAFRRFLNASAALQNLARRKEEAAARRGTLSRSQQRSFGGRVLGLMIVSSTLFGGVLLTTMTAVSIMESIRLDDIAASQTIVLSAEDHDQLQQASETPGTAARAAAVEDALKRISEGWTGTWTKPRVLTSMTDRFARRGLEGFAAGPLDPALRGDLSLLSPDARRRAVRAIALFALIFNVASTSLALAAMNRSLSGNDPVIGWLWQFPVSRKALFFCRLAEQAFDTPTAVLNAILAAVIFSQSGAGFWSGAALSILFGVTAAVLSAAARLALEVILLQSCGRKTRGVIIATGCALGNFALLFCLLGSGAPSTTRFVAWLADHTPTALLFQPWSPAFGSVPLLIESRAVWAVTAVGLAAIACVAAIQLAERLTAAGIATPVDAARAAPNGRPSRLPVGSWLRGLMWKEWTQVTRQPELLLQALFAPLLILGLIALRDPEASFQLMTRDAGMVCVSIFTVAAYILSSATGIVLTREFQSLWILQTLPRPLADAVRGKARFWGALVLLPASSIAIWSLSTLTDVGPLLVRLPFLALFVGLFAEVMFGAIALGATVPVEGKVRYRQSMWFLPALVGIQAAAALYVGSLWSLIGSLVIFVMVRLAVWQRLQAELPWISEPIETPPRTFDVAHALLSIGAFLQLRDVLSPIFAQSSLGNADGPLLGFAVSAAVILGSVGLWQWRSGITPPPLPAKAFAWRTLAAVISLAAMVAFTWILALRHSPQVVAVATELLRLPASAAAIDTSAGLRVLAFLIVAPIFEEWLFRGLLFRSLRAMHGAAASVLLSASLFTIIHPLDSSVGVFALGVLTAAVSESTGRLWTAMLVHFAYNATVMLTWTWLAR